MMALSTSLPQSRLVDATARREKPFHAPSSRRHEYAPFQAWLPATGAAATVWLWLALDQRGPWRAALTGGHTIAHGVCTYRFMRCAEGCPMMRVRQQARQGDYKLLDGVGVLLGNCKSCHGANRARRGMTKKTSATAVLACGRE